MSQIIVDEDDIPPPLVSERQSPSPQTVHSPPKPNDDSTLMDHMMKISMAAKLEKDKEKRELQKKRSKQFGSGLKKGFFVAKNTSEKPKKTSQSTPASKNDIPTITANPTMKTDSLRLPDVQQAMKKMNSLDPKEWINDDLMSNLSQNPKLLQALNDPRFSQVLEDIKKNPGEAVQKYEKNPQLKGIFMEFMSFLGGHFEKLAKSKQKEESSSSRNLSKEEISKIQHEAISNMEVSAQEEEQVKHILQDPELQDILADINMQNILQKCQQPGELRKYALDPKVGPKLKKLFDAGLIQMHP